MMDIAILKAASKSAAKWIPGDDELGLGEERGHQPAKDTFVVGKKDVRDQGLIDNGDTNNKQDREGSGGIGWLRMN